MLGSGFMWEPNGRSVVSYARPTLQQTTVSLMPLMKTSPAKSAECAEVVGFYEPDTGSIQYIAIDTATKRAALIDVVLDFDPSSARTATQSSDNIINFVEENGLSVDWILDTHPHADHLMASARLKDRIGAPTAIGERTTALADTWNEIYNLSGALDPRRAFDRLLADGERLDLGNLKITVMDTPGHTPASVSFIVGADAAFVADTLMHVDFGTARADFPGGSARTLYKSIQKIFALPDDTRVFVGHDYGTDEREQPAWEASIAEHKARNKHVGEGVGEDEFVEMREARDETLTLPDRMLHALQVNLRGGRLPEPDSDGHCYLKIPVNKL